MNRAKVRTFGLCSPMTSITLNRVMIDVKTIVEIYFSRFYLKTWGEVLIESEQLNCQCQMSLQHSKSSIGTACSMLLIPEFTILISIRVRQFKNIFCLSFFLSFLHFFLFDCGSRTWNTNSATHPPFAGKCMERRIV